LAVARCYVDEDTTEHLVPALEAFDYDAISTRQMGFKGTSDPRQLAFAAHEQRIFITGNLRHYEMLHEAWTTWPRNWSIDAPPSHAGILVVPNGREILLEQIVVILREIVPLSNRMFFWKAPGGWREITFEP